MLAFTTVKLFFLLNHSKSDNMFLKNLSTTCQCKVSKCICTEQRRIMHIQQHAAVPNNFRVKISNLQKGLFCTFHLQDGLQIFQLRVRPILPDPSLKTSGLQKIILTCLIDWSLSQVLHEFVTIGNS